MYCHRARRVERIINQHPKFTCFKPAGVPKNKLEHLDLLLEEYEVIRLTDLQGLSMQEGADKMGVSASTFNRMIKSAHRKIADAIVHGKGIRFPSKDSACD